MTHLDRILIGTLAAGVWTLIALQGFSGNQTFAQDEPLIEQSEGDETTLMRRDLVNATEIVGLNALIEKVIRDAPLRPQSISGLDQYVKSVVRGCRVSGGVTGDRISYASISC